MQIIAKFEDLEDLQKNTNKVNGNAEIVLTWVKDETTARNVFNKHPDLICGGDPTDYTNIPDLYSETKELSWVWLESDGLHYYNPQTLD